jgi:hypothetical protein
MTNIEAATKIDRYLAVVRWAQHRYAIDGALVVEVGGAPSPYSRIEAMARERFLG